MKTRQTQQTTILIDRIKCDGHGLCAELLPEILHLDEWGYPLVDQSVVPEELLGHAKRAVSACPVLAIWLEARIVSS